MHLVHTNTIPLDVKSPNVAGSRFRFLECRLVVGGVLGWWRLLSGTCSKTGGKSAGTEDRFQVRENDLVCTYSKRALEAQRPRDPYKPMAALSCFLFFRPRRLRRPLSHPSSGLKHDVASQV